VTIELGDSFKEGTSLRDAYSGQVVGGLVLLEPVKQNKKARPFDYRNANIYDQSYGRQKDGKEEIGTFHGGDLKGVIEKLDYIQSLLVVATAALSHFMPTTAIGRVILLRSMKTLAAMKI